MKDIIDIISNVTLGAIGIVATVVLYFCSSTYQIGYKKKVKYYLELARNYNYQIRNYQAYVSDYDKVLHCVERMYECVFQYIKISFLFLSFMLLKTKS